MNIYVGNLTYGVTDTSLQVLFERFGTVSSARVIKDKFTDNSKGFGFVEMSNAAEASKAIAELNGTQFEGRTLVVNEARPREESNHNSRPPRGNRY